VIVDVVITIGDPQLQSCITNWCTSWLHIYTYFLVVLLSIGESVSYPIDAVLYYLLMWCGFTKISLYLDKQNSLFSNKVWRAFTKPFALGQK